MKIEIKKVSKIVSELINFCLNNSSKKVEVSVEDKKDRFEIIIKTNNINCTDEQIEYIDELLNVTRQSEVEEYYWQLTGEDYKDQEISLVGMMVDESIIKWEKPLIEIKLIRYKDV